MNKSRKGLAIYFSIVAFLFVLVCSACYMLEKNTHYSWTPLSFIIVLIIASFVAFVVWLGHVLLMRKVSFHYLERRDIDNRRLKYIYVIWIAIFLSWIPAFLAYYPGIAAFDVEGYFFQFLYGPYNNQHPIAYTLILKELYYFGIDVFSSNSIGVALLVLLQMIFLSFSMFFSLRVIYKISHRLSICVVLGIIYALYPYNIYMSLTMTKDTVFAAGFLLLFSSLLAYIYIEQAYYYVILISISELVVILFRSNGIYCVPILISIMLVVINKKLMRVDKKVLLLITMLVIMISGFFCLKGLDKLTNAQEVDKREMFSLPAQQIARVVKYHKDELPQETINDIETLIWPSALYSYKASIADPVKADVISWEILHHYKKYIKLYFNLMRKYPEEYFNAFVGLYSGFLSPFDGTHVNINDCGDGVPDGLHTIQTRYNIERYGIYQNSKLRWLFDLYEYYANNDLYIKIPLLRAALVPGIFLWILVVAVGIAIYQRKEGLVIAILLDMILFATFFLGPTVQIRYIYPIILTIPIIIAMLLVNIERTKVELE